MLRSMVLRGADQNAVCIALGITNKTLHKHHRGDLDRAYTELVVSVRLRVVEAAAGGDVQALIYLCRVTGWHDQAPARPAVGRLQVQPIDDPATWPKWEAPRRIAYALTLAMQAMDDPGTTL